jgi:Protein of unknown function (DUF4038)/Putative collagen-binding domain of a collagenase/IPT/TIG domain
MASLSFRVELRKRDVHHFSQRRVSVPSPHGGIVKRCIFLILIFLSPLIARAQVANQLVTIGPNGKYLYNSITGQPVFITGEDGFLATLQITDSLNETYLNDRAAIGYNAVWLGLIDQLDQNNEPHDGEGNLPFTSGGVTPDNWFGTLNSTYWSRIDTFVSKASALGITVFLHPSFIGNHDGNVYDTPQWNGATTAQIQSYCTTVASRYASANNIVYVLGGDYDPSNATIFGKVNACGAAIRAADPNHLITIEGFGAAGGSNLSTSPYTTATLPSWLGINWAYMTQATAVQVCQNAYNNSPFLPPLQGEDWYEDEHSVTGFQVRQEGYWEVLSGCYTGRMFGNHEMWSFNANNAGPPTTPWQTAISSIGSVSQQFMGALFRSREHWLMVPDTSHSVLTAGFGSGSTLSVASRTSDGQTVIAYFSDGNATAKTIDMSAITSSSSTAIAWWYAPLTGTATLIGTFPNSGSQSFTAPDGNDWVLVIDDAAANLGAPGGGTGNNPIPSITSLSPTSAIASGPAFTLTVNGTGFISASVVNFNGSARTTSFVSTTQIKASILASDIATSGNANVTVTNPSPGGGTTANFAFTISSASNPAPTLTSISPTSGLLGQSVPLTLNGTNFISSSIVNFGSNQNTGGVVSNGGNTLTITIPAAQLTAAGPVNVTVTNPAPGGGTTGAQTFTVNNPAPSIATISPTGATVNGAGFTLTVNGSNFVNGSIVNFNGAAKSTTFVSATQVTASILATDLLTVGNVPVTVTNPAPGGGTSASVTFAVTNPPPTLASLSPSSATAGGAFTLTLTGVGFVSGATVNFGASPAITPSSVTSTQIVATVPAADIAIAGSVNVTVTNPAPGGGTSNAQTFTINNPVPTASSLSPTSATAGGAGFTLTVNGTGFVSTSVVKFNGAAKATTFVSATQITAAITAPDIATAGTANVAVTNPAPGGGTSGNVSFTINNPAVTITSLSPPSTTAGGPSFALTINGSGFVNGATVNFGANPAITPSSVTSTQIIATIPASEIATAGTSNVTVTNPPPGGGTSGAQVFTINNPVPTEVSIVPPSATVGGSAFTLTVNGTGFVSGSVVKFNGVVKATTFISTTQLTAAIAAADIATAGTVNVAVTSPAPGGGTSGNIQFTINNPNVTVASLSPPSTTAGGAAFTLTINGSGFASGATVNFGSNPAITPSSVTSTQITATIPAADISTGGTANVTVTNPPPGGGISSAQTFTINNPAPAASSVSPASAAAGGTGFKLTVNGTGFVSGSVVNFNGAAKTTTFVSATQITALITAADIATAGTVNVAVTNSAPGGGTSANLQFTINNPSNLTITSLSPASATAGGAAFTLTVNGTGFVNGATVQFNGANRTTTFVGSTQVMAAITTADIATAGTVNVTVTNPAPGGGTSNFQAFTINNPSTLAITSLSPSSTTAGGVAFSLTVNGTGFISGAVVNLSGVAKATTFKSATQLSAAITASDIATGGVLNVTVTNPASGGGTSNAATFTVNNAVPALTSLSPSGVFVGSGAFTLTVNGTGFVNGATVQLNGANRVTTFVSSTQLMVAIMASDIAAAGTANVTVTNPAPTTGPSASLALNISNESNPVPAISTLGANHVTGGAAFTLSVNGSNFVAKSVVNFNGKAEATTFVSAKTISAAIPASDVAVAGSINVTVTNPTPGGGTSPAFTLFVDGYTVGGTSTASVASGQPATLQITVTPTANGFANPVMFTISGLPSGVTSLFSPSSVTPDAKPVTTMLTITDGGAAVTRAKSQAGILGGGITPSLLLLCVIALLAWVGIQMRGRSIPQMRRYATVGLFVFMLFAGSVLGGCALGVTSSPGSQTSQVTVMATSGTLTQTFGITLTITR